MKMIKPVTLHRIEVRPRELDKLEDLLGQECIYDTERHSLKIWRVDDFRELINSSLVGLDESPRDKSAGVKTLEELLALVKDLPEADRICIVPE